MTTIQSLKRPRFIQLSNAGGFVRARFAGKANSVFAATKSEAIERLESGNLPSKTPKYRS